MRPSTFCNATKLYAVIEKETVRSIMEKDNTLFVYSKGSHVNVLLNEKYSEERRVLFV